MSIIKAIDASLMVNRSVDMTGELSRAVRGHINNQDALADMAKQVQTQQQNRPAAATKAENTVTVRDDGSGTGNPYEGEGRDAEPEDPEVRRLKNLTAGPGEPRKLDVKI